MKSTKAIYALVISVMLNLALVGCGTEASGENTILDDERDADTLYFAK